MAESVAQCAGTTFSTEKTIARRKSKAASWKYLDEILIVAARNAFISQQPFSAHQAHGRVLDSLSTSVVPLTLSELGCEVCFQNAPSYSYTRKAVFRKKHRSIQRRE